MGIQENTVSEQSSIELPAHLPAPSRISIRSLDDSDVSERVARISEELSVSNVTARILVGRGYDTPESAKAFLYPTLREHLPDPSQILNIAQAADLIIQSVESGEQITVYSDFDVDGLSSGSQLDLFLSSLGARVNHYTPNRFTEGYGLVKSAVEKLAQAGTQLLVTVDCGVTNAAEIKLAKQFGMKVVVVDHHQVQELPEADVVVDPAQDGCPFQEHKLCAAGLVWMLCIVIRRQLGKEKLEELKAQGHEPIDVKSLLDLAALGTICDMVPLVGVNRVIASRGIEALRDTKRPGLVALKEAAGVDNQKRFGSGHVSFAIGPRINAAGRLEDPNQVFELLITKSMQKAKKIAKRINKLNKERRSVEESVRLSCVELVNETGLNARGGFAIYDQDFHAGVIGIVAQRLVEQFHKPSAVMTLGEMQQGKETIPVIKGSVRSIRGFHVAQALAECGEFLLKHGGHEAAGGFSLKVEDLEAFQEKFISLAEQKLSKDDFVRKRTADVEVTLEELSFDVANELLLLQPFGTGNPSPLLVARDVQVESVQSLGNGHLKLRFAQGDSKVTAVAWRFRGHPLLARGKRASIAFQAEINAYKGLSTVQLNIREVWQD